MCDLVQALNPRSKRYVLIDRDAGMIIKHKRTPGPFKNVPIAVRRTPDEERQRTAEYLNRKAAEDMDRRHFVTLDPRMCSSAPQVYGVPTAVIAGRFRAGDDDIKELAFDYGLSVHQVYIALAYERCVIDKRVEGVAPE